MSQPTALPYGIRDVKLTRYTDGAGQVMAANSVDLPNMQTLSFSETEEFSELRGDDRLIATRGQGAQVEWEIEAGGISFAAWSVLTGGEVILSGVTPNRKTILRKRGTDTRPYFRIDGQALSDSGGDVITRIYRARVNDTVEGEFGDGEFFATSASGLGLPLLGTEDLLYDFIQNETSIPLTLVPEPNPLTSPQELTVGVITSTSVALEWEDVQNADSYVVEQSSDGEVFTDVAEGAGGEVEVSQTIITGLTAATTYYFRVRSVGVVDESDPSTAIQVSTLAA